VVIYFLEFFVVVVVVVADLRKHKVSLKKVSADIN
jgi:hypothetical protein